ncbi:GPR1/FUN34/yaaH family-domain-containing protein [Emericellopsis atlantica]|uniref:GPR1/FUN34/yaaH family-domain-containing protein n=1 Tax=Emericellopsis atlantica TaxID=2614577 RepID=A0A9P8CSW1_9HYPO|nr:GPR1/FUN34/yaaH family-domain-containing protein [Emericellopsis atlantica]KAG9258223.1 GPR1/FUN34/yaaH family-domain-containing protein [Emericellopsis atlantica]
MATAHGTEHPEVTEKHDGITGPRASQDPQAPHSNNWHQRRDLASWGHGYAPAEGASLHPGVFRPYEHRKFANPAPLGLSAFALTTFVLSAINMEARSVTVPSVVVPLAFGYGGLVQLLAGMWEMAVGNTFGATALSSYGGFWIAYGLLLTPSPWGILEADGPYEGDTSSPVGFFLTGWFIFTTILLVCTLRSTVAFFLLFFTLDIAFLCLSVENYARDMGNEVAATNLKKAGGFFGFLAAFLAWYNALAGIQDSSNSFFTVPVIHFPWSDKGREQRGKKESIA